MSGVAGIYNIPRTAPEFNTWAFVHAAHHTDIIRRIYELSGVVLPDYILDPVDPTSPEDTRTWVYQHQQMHNQVNFLLEVEGYNLTALNWKDEQLTSDWILFNATEHKRYADLLEIG